MSKIGKQTIPQPFNLTVMISSGEVLMIDKGIKGCPLKFDGHSLLVDLLVLDMSKFNIILGLDWLSKNNASIDYRAKFMSFNPPRQVPWKFTFV